MPSLILTQDTLRVTLLSKRLEIFTRGDGGDGESGGETSSQVPLYDIDRVIVCGRPAVSMPVLATLMDEGIPVFFLTSHGRWRGSLTPDNNLNAGRRIRQYEKDADPAFALGIARRLVHAKIRNSRRMLQRLASNRGESAGPAHRTVCDLLKFYAAQALAAESAEIARGIEGLAAACYFHRLSSYFPPSMPFPRRSRRPPKDPANALLSWTYTVLLAEVEGAVRAHGLDAAIGCLHRGRISSPSLALDLIEPLRPAVADLLVLNLVNHQILKPPAHFETDPSDGGVYLNADGRRAFFASYEQAVTRRFSLAPGAPHTDIRRVIDAQVCAYIRALEQGDPPEFFLLP